MADIFLSYAKKDRTIAAAIADALREQGYSVRDGLKEFTGVSRLDILREINAVKCVIVLMSVTSLKRRYLRDEAEAAVEQRKLIPVRIDDCEIPSEYRHIQAVDLRGWSGALDDPDWQSLVAVISNFVERPGDKEADEHRPSTTPKSQNSFLLVVLLMAIVMGVITAGYFYINRDAILTTIQSE